MNSASGILLLDKSIEMTSNTALQRVKRLFSLKKAGHTGSLDPLATGMLPICFGEATKFSQFLLESDKYYRVTAQLGVKTSTGDAEGEVIANTPVVGVTHEKILQVLQQFIGEIQQIPPMHSAIKMQGKPLYKLARKGISVTRAPRTVRIHHLQLIEFAENYFTIEVHSSKGTYVRTLIEDIGDQLGCGAHVSCLRRLAVMPYQNEAMYSLDHLTEILQQQGYSGLEKLLLPVETTLQKLPRVQLITASAFYFRTGHAVMAPNLPASGLVCVVDENGKLLGVGEVQSDGRLAPKRLVSSAM